jgi:hypothetical protein
MDHDYQSDPQSDAARPSRPPYTSLLDINAHSLVWTEGALFGNVHLAKVPWLPDTERPQ